MTLHGRFRGDLTDTGRLDRRGVEMLETVDPGLSELLERELHRQHNTLAMVAASSVADPTVLACGAAAIANLTTEGYPGRRFHAGCEVADEIERLAINRACDAFGARYANVQPHSGSAANIAMITTLLAPGDTLLGMDLASGGHLTHGSPASFVSTYANTVGYGVGGDGLIDYDEVARIAERTRPRLIICGASAYPRGIDFRRFRSIADDVGALLLADISHIAGLVVTGLHPTPIDAAHVTTTSTYKQLYGPRGGLILLGESADRIVDERGRRLRDLAQRAVFPASQGTPDLARIAAKARALANVLTDTFALLCGRIVGLAAALADALRARGFKLVSDGTDNHMLLVDLRPLGLTGDVAERALESCGILVNRNRVPGDTTPARVGAGLRLGTNTVALRGMNAAGMEQVAAIFDRVLSSVSDAGPAGPRLPDDVRAQVRDAVTAMCRRHPIPDYPPPSR